MQVNRLLFEVPCQNTLGEGIIWQAQEQAIYWTDIQGKSLYKCLLTNEVTNILCADSISESARQSKDEYLNQVLQVFDLPFRLGSFAFTNHNDTILAGFENGLALYHYISGKLQWLARPEQSNPNTRFNDGRCDPLGRFWLGSMLEGRVNFKKLPVEEQAALYRFELTTSSSNNNLAQVNQVLGGLHISNGLCFTQDAKTMYHTDSPSHKIYSYNLDLQGKIVERKLFAKFEKHSFPDGCCVDIHGNLWVALWGGACVACLNSKGKELFRHPLPVTQGSCTAIGGPDMNWLFVTSAQEGLSEEQKQKQQPRAGNMFVYELSEAVGRVEPHVDIVNP